MIIAISGRMGSGKDLIGKIIQYLTLGEEFSKTNGDILADLEYNGYCANKSNFRIKKFADKLKDIVCILLGCTREQLEDREFKEKELGKEWGRIITSDGKVYLPDEYPDLEYSKLTPRLLLQLLGTDCGRDIIHPNIWVNSLMSEYKTKSTLVSEVNYLGDSRCGICKKPTKDISYFLCDEHVEKSKNNFPNWIITDLRFPNELEAVKKRGGITIRVNRDNILNINKKGKAVLIEGKWIIPHDKLIPKKYWGKQISTKDFEWQERIIEHESETTLDNVEFDYTIDNNGTLLELVEKVRKILIKEKIINE